MILAALPPKERAFFELVELLPFEALQACYRKAAMMLHPDRNSNDGDKMARLNTAWNKIEEEFKK
jgi:curved DNA-binding protein CbpA